LSFLGSNRYLTLGRISSGLGTELGVKRSELGLG